MRTVYPSIPIQLCQGNLVILCTTTTTTYIPDYSPRHQDIVVLYSKLVILYIE